MASHIEFGDRAWCWTLVILAVVAVIVAAVVALHFGRLSAQRVKLKSAATSPSIVQIVRARATSTVRSVTVLASVHPYQEATLYAKVSGYVGRMLVDKGDVVQAGQLIAFIQSQETEAQYNSARADFTNKQRIATRYRQLLSEGAVAPLLADQADADSRIASATLDQAETLKSYQRLVAPFAGRVTARFVDPGDLIQNATTSQIAAQPVVTVSDSSSLRIDAYVQQDVAPYVHAGDIVDIIDATATGRAIRAKVTRVAGELDPRTRTMLVEAMINDRGKFLLAGSFAYMTLHLPAAKAVQVPVGALVTRGDDHFVASVGRDSRVHYIKVGIGFTDGDVVTLSGGIKAGERLAVDLPAEATEGTLVSSAEVLAGR